MNILKVPDKGISQAVVYEVRAEQGQQVEKGQLLMTLKTDQAIIELACPVSGSVRRLTAYPGKVVAPGEVLAAVGEEGEQIPDSFVAAETQSSKEQTEDQSTPEQGTSKQSPTKKKKTDMAGKTEKTTKPGGKVIPILMPQAGQSMEEGTILEWKVKPGDNIEVGQVICEIETDKANMEVEAVDSGRLARIVARQDDIVEVKKPIAYLAEKDEDVDVYLARQGEQPEKPKAAGPEKTPAAAEEKAPAQSAQAPATTIDEGRVKASPAARKLAAQRGIELSSIGTGSGAGGRIITGDIKKAQAPPAGPRKVQVSKMRRAIAQNLLWSKQNIPHFYTRLTIDATPMYEKYQQLKQQFKCSVNDLIVRACAVAVRQMPAFRRQYRDGSIIEQPNVNLGIAVGTPDGLTVPVVVKADQLDFRSLAAKTKEVVEAARNGKLEGVGQGVFTITNLGMFGVEEFSAIINPPESAILSVGAIREDTKVENGAIRPTKVMTIVLSSDHRIVDGVLGAQFMQRIKELLEDPEKLL